MKYKSPEKERKINMEIVHIMQTARSATIEIKDGGRYFTKRPYIIKLNGKEAATTDKTITSLYGLKPDTKYVAEVFCGNTPINTV